MDERKPGDSSGEGGVGRREFLHGMGAAGLVGAAGMAGFEPRRAPSRGSAKPAERKILTAPDVAEVVSPQEAPEFTPPAGLNPGAQLDCRWPLVYEETIPTSLRLVMAHFAALSNQDLEGIADTMHFPFAIFEQTDPILFETREDFMRNPPMTLAPAGMQVSHPGHFTGRIGEGSYNLFESIDVELFCIVGSVVSLSFTRYDAGGNRLARSDGIYTVTNNDGRWGIELISTIMTPTEHLIVPNADAELSAMRAGQDSMLRYTNRHKMPWPDNAPEPAFYGGRASISFGYGPRARAGDARNNRPTQGWRTEGVTSRLSFSDRTTREEWEAAAAEDAMEPDDYTPDPDNPQFGPGYNFDQFAEWAGGNVGQWGDTWTNPYQPHVIHADRQKAHTIGGYIRHTPDLTMISETRSISIRAYRNGRWGSVGGIGQVTWHDRSNSYPAV